MRRPIGICAFLSLLMALPLFASAQPPPPSPPGIRYALSGDSDWVNSLALSADGLSFASASSDFTVKIWRTSDGTLLRTFVTGYPNRALSVALSPDGTTVAAGDNQNNIWMWSLIDDSQIHMIASATVGGVLSLSYSSDGSTLAACGTGKTITLYNTSDGSLQRTLTGHTAQVNQVAFSPVVGQANLLASVSQDLTVRLWNTKSGATSSTPLTAFANQANCLAFSRDGTQLAVGGLDSTTNASARVWSVVNKSLGSIKASIVANGGYAVSAIAFSQDGTLLATGTGGLVNTFTISSGAPVSSFNINTNTTLTGLAFSNDGSTITCACTGPNYGILQSSVSTGTLTRAVTQFQSNVTYMAFSPDSSRMALNEGGQTQFRSVPTGAVLPIYGIPNSSPFTFSPDGTLFAAGGTDDIYNLSSGATLSRAEHCDYIWISADDQKVYTMGYYQHPSTLKTWRMADDVLLNTNILYSGGGGFLTISNDQKRILCSTSFNGISVLSIPDGAAIQSFSVAGINSNYSLSGDGSYLAFGDTDAYIYRVSDGMQMLDQPGSFGVVSVAISPFGDSVAVFRTDGSITITAIDGTPVAYWNDQLGPFGYQNYPIIQYTPDAASIVIARTDATVLVCYNPAPAALASLTLSQVAADGGVVNPQGTVGINLPAPAGGVPIQLSSSNPAIASVPSSMLIAQNATTAIFPVTTQIVTAPTVVTISATLNGVTRAVNLTVNPSVASKALAFAPITVQGGIPSVGVVTLLKPALTGGQVVMLSSANPGLVGVPASVIVPVGKTSARFVALTGPTAVTTPVVVTATSDGVPVTGTLTVAPAAITALSILPKSVIGGVENAIGIVTLASAATTDVTVAISVTTAGTAGDVTFPTSIVISAGSINGVFDIGTSSVKANAVVTFKAQIGVTGKPGTTNKTGNLTVIP